MRETSQGWHPTVVALLLGLEDGFGLGWWGQRGRHSRHSWVSSWLPSPPVLPFRIHETTPPPCWMSWDQVLKRTVFHGLLPTALLSLGPPWGTAWAVCTEAGLGVGQGPFLRQAWRR